MHQRLPWEFVVLYRGWEGGIFNENFRSGKSIQNLGLEIEY